MHHGYLVDPDVTGAEMLGGMVLSALLTGGMFIGYVAEASVNNTYFTLLNLATGELLWSNFSPQGIGALPVSAYSKSPDFGSDSAKKENEQIFISHWKGYLLKCFPKHGSSKYSKGFAPPRIYSKLVLFKPFPPPPSPDLGKRMLSRIDSLLLRNSVFVVSQDTAKNEPLDVHNVKKGMPKGDLKDQLKQLWKYIEYAFQRSLKRNNEIKGRMEVEVVISSAGNVLNSKVKSSTLNDQVFENVILAIIKSFKFTQYQDSRGDTYVDWPLEFQL
jgi:TonB family protein